MAWKAIHFVSDSMEGKLVHFKSQHSATDLTGAFGTKKTKGEDLHIPAGSTGILYRINGPKLFIGFERDLKTHPSKLDSPGYFAYAIEFYLDDIDKLEIES